MRSIVLAAGVLSAFANWWSRMPLPASGPPTADGVARRRHRAELITKPLTTVLVIGVAACSGAAASWTAIAVIALVLCLVGDVALMPVVDNFVLGLGAFLLGHLAFIVLFVQYGLEAPVLAVPATITALVVAATVGRRILTGSRRADPALQLPVLAYLMVILATAVVGWATGRPWVLVGTACFVVSDSILGWEVFVRGHRWMPAAVMATYHAALFTLALSLW